MGRHQHLGERDNSITGQINVPKKMRDYPFFGRFPNLFSPTEEPPELISLNEFNR